MLTEIFTSVRDNFKQKTTNPFFGTLVLIWLAKNWRLVYAVFTFESTYKLEQRIQFIETYYQQVSFSRNLLICVFLTIFSLVISYLLLNFSRLIINFYEKKITPWIYQITDKNSVVLKRDFDKLQGENDRLSEKYESEKKRRIILATENEELEKKYWELIEKMDDTIVSNTNLLGDEEDTSLKVFNKLKADEALFNIFKKARRSFSVKGYISTQNLSQAEIIRLSDYGLIERGKGNSVISYFFTELGKSVEKLLLNDLVKD